MAPAPTTAPTVARTAPIDHLLEQLWQPAVDTGRARLVISSRRHRDESPWRAAERYLLLPTPARATMLLPADPPAATAGSLTNYRGLRRRLPNLQRATLGAAARTHLRLPFAIAELQVRDDTGPAPLLPLAMLTDVLDAPQPLRASIGVRTSANRKATLQLVDVTGAPRGFAKFAWDPSSTEGILREGHALRTPLVSGPARSPALLASGEYYGRPYIVTQPLPLTTHGARGDVPAPSPAELFALAPLARRSTLSASGQFKELVARADALTDSPLKHRVSDLLESLGASAEVLPLSERCHGDLTPWNAARDRDGTLWCWDWESSEEDAVVGLDPLHWHVTVRTEAGERLSGDLFRAATHDARPALVAAGMSSRQQALAAGVYVATLVERAASLAAGAGGWEAGWVLPDQLTELISTAERMLT